ncbi:MAG TPA: DUF86 domain-containing protein [Spirochaetes bacterium]|nr:DUF86 domain-containing protein [Spirochaetota bacterium]
MNKNSLIYLKHVLDAIKQIEEYTVKVDDQDFLINRLIQDAVIRQIEIIGEAIKRVSLAIKNKYPDIPWKNIAGMRDKLIHDYFGVDIEAVWETVQKDIPVLKKDIQDLLNKEKT